MRNTGCLPGVTQEVAAGIVRFTTEENDLLSVAVVGDAAPPNRIVRFRMLSNAIT